MRWNNRSRQGEAQPRPTAELTAETPGSRRVGKATTGREEIGPALEDSAEFDPVVGPLHRHLVFSGVGSRAGATTVPQASLGSKSLRTYPLV